MLNSHLYRPHVATWNPLKLEAQPFPCHDIMSYDVAISSHLKTKLKAKPLPCRDIKSYDVATSSHKRVKT